MEHKICFQDIETGWHNALPLGNGKMGAMVYYMDRSLHIALNNYDCYYHILPQYAKCQEGKLNAAFDDPARRKKTYEDIKAAAEKASGGEDYSRTHYLRTLNPSESVKRPLYKGGSYPQGGELTVQFSEKVDISHSTLILHIEEAYVEFAAGEGQNKVGARIYVSKEYDGVAVELSQKVQGLWKQAGIWRQEARGQGNFSYEDGAAPEILFMRCRFRPDGESERTNPFVQETTFYLPGAGADGDLSGCGEEFCLTGSVKAGSVRAGEGGAEDTARELWENLTEDRKNHKNVWGSFWRSTVKLPDSYLETLWHLYVYLLECCSGRGSVHSEQACGLSGMWDIRRPCMWGSMWYWDVNIQTAFYGAFASNHMEHVQVFCDAFLSCREDVKHYTEEVYGREGWALDYPHTLYNCIQPWCALFLWNYYSYTGDMDFLRERAYPVFMEMAEFYRWLGKKDKEGIRHINFDICPEQGPVTQDSVITTAAVKQMLRYACSAAELLGRPAEELDDLRQLLSEMPQYAVAADGSRWKDSPLVQDNIFLRHPSVLMPVFPAEEVHMGSREAQARLADGTIRYAAENTETGTFGFEWVAAAAARMGAGESALRILYEKGLDYITHSNGLGYEESERFINYCHLTKPANYLPAMCEAGGGVTAVINLMLLQDIDGILHVFPAVPDGEDRYAVHKTQYCHDDTLFTKSYGPWKDCGFEGLLAPGGFVVSAQMLGGEVVWVQVKAQQDGVLCISLPAGLSGLCSLAGQNTPEVYRKEMKAGETVSFGCRVAEPVCIEDAGVRGESAAATEEKPEPASSAVLVHKAAQTHRRTFIGEDRNTAFYKAIDAMVCPYGFADTRRYAMTPYIFDFTEEQEKNYDEVYYRQLIEAGRSVLFAGGPRCVSAESYSCDRGYGFVKAPGVTMAGREKPDALRRDFAQGEETAEFGIELPAGKYDLLVISGDEDEESLTHLAVCSPEANSSDIESTGARFSGIRMEGRRQAPGRYQCRLLPVVHGRDGILKVSVSTDPGMKWKLNAIFINKEYLLL